jgi:hypothetical protein
MPPRTAPRASCGWYVTVGSNTGTHRKFAVPLDRYRDAMAKTTSLAVLVAAMVVNFLLWWGILTSAAWGGDAATSAVVAAVH